MLGPRLNPLRLALIGMSGSGKTFWANLLAQAGHPVISCDARIEERLRADLQPGGHRGTEGVAAWMGWPDRDGYPQRAAKYLAAEIAVMDETLAALERDPVRELVLDTTGSVVYTGEATRERLRRLMSVVYFEASPEEQALLIARYVCVPKPVLWRDAYRPQNAEAASATVSRCFPMLMEERRRLYEVWAHCVLPIRALREGPLDATRFLSLIQQNCRCAE
jgi:shikimate kinase